MTTRYTFQRKPDSRYGDLYHVQAGLVARNAYLTLGGWCFYSAGAHLTPEQFTVQEPAQASLPLSRLITESMRHARRLLERAQL